MTQAAELAGYASSLPQFRNKIINGHLKSAKVIKQRGISTITGATGYTFDRWYYNGSNLYQGIEDANVENGTYVISWEGSGYSAAWKVSTEGTANNGPDDTTGFFTVSNGGTFTVNETPEFSKHLWIRFSLNTALSFADLDKVQVELGTVATPFEHRPIGVELSLCQRYYCQFDSGSAFHAVNGAGINIPHSFPVTMKSTPSLTDSTVTSSGNQASGYPTFSSVGTQEFQVVQAPNVSTGINIYANYTIKANAEL